MFNDNFTLFGVSHLIILVILLLGSFFTVLVLPKLSTTIQQIFQKFLIVGCIAQILTFNLWHIVHNSFDIARLLPFHLCSFSVYLIPVALLFRRDWLLKLIIFWSPISALIAIILPDMSRSDGFGSFRFLEFFWSHILIVWASLFIISTLKPKIKYRDLWISCAILVVSLIPVSLINWLSGGNYMYLVSRPSGGQMNFLPSEPYHIIGLMILVNLVFHLEFAIAKLLNTSKKQTCEN